MASDNNLKEGRPAEELLRSRDTLKCTEALRLRQWFSTFRMDPTHDLDTYGRALYEGDIAQLKADWYAHLARFLPKTNSEECAHEAAAQEVYLRHWSAARLPVFHLLLVARAAPTNTTRRAQHLAIARWLISTVRLPVDSMDVCGSSALFHALEVPTFDPEFAQVLYDAGGDVNHRNRFGMTAAHEIALLSDAQDEKIAQRAADALAWYLSHSGNIDIRDNDGQTARMSVDSSRKLAEQGIQLPIWDVVDKEDRRRKKLGENICTFCGRAPEGEGKDYLLVCSRCKIATYCPPPRHCQLGDWPRHRLTCAKHQPAEQGSKYFGVKLNK